MKTSARKYLSVFFLAFSLVFSLVIYSQAFAANTQEAILEQEILGGSLVIYFVDSLENVVEAPSVDFPSIIASISPVTSSGVLGTADEMLRIDNPLSSGFELNIAPELNTGIFQNDAVWLSGIDTFPIYSTDVDSGSLGIDPTTAILDGCAGVNIASASSFLFVDDGDPNTNVESISLVNAPDSGYCRLDLTDIELNQRIPGQQPTGTYELGMVLTVTAIEEEIIVVDPCYLQQSENTGTIAEVNRYDFVTECPTNISWSQTSSSPEIWRDNTTGLYWTEQLPVVIDWYDIVNYCGTLTHGGRTDWRLPTRDELMQVAPEGINTIGCEGCYSGHNLYGSTSETFRTDDHMWAINDMDATYAWVVRLYTGYVDFLDKVYAGPVFGFRCVARD